MKIVFFEISKEKQVFYENYFKDFNIVFSEDNLDDNNVNIAYDADIIHVFVNSSVNKNILEKLPNLKFIATSSTGYDHIDLDYCKERNILVSNVPAYGSETVAEFTFALLLALSRKVYYAYRNLIEDTDFSLSGLQGFDLSGKTLGVIGTGKIGKNVVKIAKGFNMNVIAYDKFEDKEFEKENNFIYKTFDEVISSSDIITLHAPCNEENFHLINKDVISKMKKGVYIINTARGELIDTEALIWGLSEKIIAGAGLDVLEGEINLKEDINILFKNKDVDYKKLLEDRILIDMENVIVTPHLAFYTKEAESRIRNTTIENIKSFINNNAINLIKF